eukprot:scaffold2677_cov112-Isochrysis_galbana.AAC.1
MGAGVGAWVRVCPAYADAASRFPPLGRDEEERTRSFVTSVAPPAAARIRCGWVGAPYWPSSRTRSTKPPRAAIGTARAAWLSMLAAAPVPSPVAAPAVEMTAGGLGEPRPQAAASAAGATDGLIDLPRSNRATSTAPFLAQSSSAPSPAMSVAVASAPAESSAAAAAACPFLAASIRAVTPCASTASTNARTPPRTHRTQPPPPRAKPPPGPSSPPPLKPTPPPSSAPPPPPGAQSGAACAVA